MKIQLTIAALFLSLCSCRLIRPAVPGLPLSQISSTPLPQSKIDVPVTIDLSAVFNDFTKKIPMELSGEGSIGPAQYRWSLQRQPFTLSLSGNSLYVVDVAHCSLGGYIKNPLIQQWTRVAACNADATIGISANFNLLNNYSLSANANLTQFDITPCDLKIINDITPVLRPHAIEAISNALTELNEKVGGYNFRQLLQPAWTALGQPIKIADIGYIVLNPSQVRFGKPTGEGNLLNFLAGITAQPVFYLTDPGKVAVSTVPDITATDSTGGFYLDMDLHLDYKPLNTFLKAGVSGKKIPIGANGYIDITSAEIYGAGNNHLLIKVKFHGKQGILPYRGLLYLTCIPQYDMNTGNFYVNDIDFDVNTVSKLKEGPAAWILSAAVKKFFSNQVHFNLAGQINTINDKLNKSLNRQISPNVTLSGKVDKLSLQGILPEADYILVRISTSGTLAASVN
jgi:hypothetical protein